MGVVYIDLKYYTMVRERAQMNTEWKRNIKDLGLCLLPFVYAVLIHILVWGVGIIVKIMKEYSDFVDQGITNPVVILENVMDGLSGNLLLFMSIISAVLYIVIYSGWYRHLVYQDGAQDDFSISNQYLVNIIFLGIGLSILVSLGLRVLEYMSPQWFSKQSYWLNDISGENPIISILYIIILVPISEELIFRGIILEKALYNMTFISANLFQAVLFGVMQGNIIQGIYSFVLGLFMGVVYNRCETIIAPVFLHMAINITGLLLQPFLSEEIFTLPVFIIGMCALALVNVIYSVRILYNSEDNVGRKDF